MQVFVSISFLIHPLLDQLLHVLAFADKLNYSTSSSVDHIFMKLKDSNRLNENYQLVILLSKQQHFLATYFDQVS